MQNISQSGRSMTEMLGTLAIIGVLSIGGVAGYSYAINKHYANELIYDIDILSNEISRYIMVHNPDTLPDDLANTTSRQNHSLESFLLDNNYFEIGILNVPQKLCQMLQNTNWKKPVSLYVGGKKYQGNNLCTSDTIGRVAYVFSDNLGENTNAEPNNGRCTTSSECTKCEACENNMCTIVKPLKIWNGDCYACDEKANLQLSAEACSVCPERISTTSAWVSFCLLPEKDSQCSGSQGSACDLPGKDYKGFCMNQQCVDMGLCPQVTYGMAKAYCSSQGGLAPVSELTAISGNPDACETTEKYISEPTVDCPTPEQKAKKGKHSQTICSNQEVWSSQVESRGTDVWSVQLRTGAVYPANSVVYTRWTLCRDQLP